MNNLNHPSEQKLLAYLHGELDKFANMQIAQHLDHCETCNQIFEEILQTQSELLPEIDAGELKLSDHHRTELIKEIEKPHIEFKIERKPKKFVLKFVALFLVIFMISVTLYRMEEDVIMPENNSNFNIATKIDNSDINQRYIISISSDQKAPLNHKPRSLTVVLDTSRSQSKQSGFKLLENHLSGIMNSITEMDKLNVIVNGTSPSLQEVQLADLSNAEALDTILEVRLSTRPELIESIDYGYQYASKTYNQNATNSVILLSSNNRAGNSLDAEAAKKESISLIVLASDESTEFTD